MVSAIHVSTTLAIRTVRRLRTALSPPSITVNPHEASLDETNTLASPRIRARNHEVAKILIGSRVPVITESVTPTAGTAAITPSNVQYLDVGLTLEVEPTSILTARWRSRSTSR